MNNPENTAIDLADAAAKDLIMGVLLDKAIALAISQVPFLGLSFVNPIFSLLMKFAAKYLYKVVSLEAAFIIIDAQTKEQRVRYEAEMEKLKTAIKEGKSNEEIKREREEAKKRLRELVSFNAN